MYNFWLNWDKFCYKLVAKPGILSTSLVVLRGNVPPLSVKRYTLPPLEFLNKGNIELHECPVKFGNYSMFVCRFYTLKLSFWSFNVHNSNLNYKHMLPCTKVGWKITYVSSSEFLGPMQKMRIKFKHLGIVARPRTLRNLVLKFL